MHYFDLKLCPHVQFVTFGDIMDRSCHFDDSVEFREEKVDQVWTYELLLEVLDAKVIKYFLSLVLKVGVDEIFVVNLT